LRKLSTKLSKKYMKKVIFIFTMFALVVAPTVASASITIGADGTSLGTTLGAGSGTGSEFRPIVKAKWEMNGPSWDYKPTRNADGSWNDDGTLLPGRGTDDDMDTPGAQFDAPGEWGALMHYTVCAIATDPNHVSDIDNVYADINYPIDRPMHVSINDPLDPAYDGDEIDNPEGGCGAKIEQNTLYRLSKDQGIALFCDNIQVNNNLLVTFADPYDYDEICNPVYGELPEEEAYVFCDDKTLTWEDPAGMYDVAAIGHDSDGPGEALNNQFEYLEFAGFEVDFTSIDYQNVIQGVRNQVSGDRDFYTTPNMPTVRNIGNVRLTIMVAQDDMEFDLRDLTNWNISYDARVGNKAPDWNGYYDPFKKHLVAGDPTDAQYERLMEVLDLSETEKMDFVVLVEKWEHGTDYQYGGTMWLDAEYAPFQSCEDPT
jgi:hypothetical protein